MRIVYAGSPEFAVEPLRAMIEGGKDVVAVITQPDRPFGRKGVITPTPVKKFALGRGIPVYDFAKIRDCTAELSSLRADIMITCAYGQILSRAVLDCFPLGVYNLHASLLPLYRGASPIQSAILSGDEYTGVTVMKTEEELDSGDILLVKRCAVGDCTCGELEQKLSHLAAEAAVEAAELIAKGNVQLLLQDKARASYCKKISKGDCRVDFAADGKKVANLINAMSPSPAAFAYLGGKAVNLLKACACDGCGKAGEVIKADKRGVVVACGAGAVNISRLQFEGGREISAADAVNGRKIKAGDVFE